MSDIAIRVENLSKAYRLGVKEERHETLVAAAVSWLRAPARNLRRLKRLDTHLNCENADDILWALKDVSFDVRAGEVVGVIGRNGAGKSTLLKILSRITEPTSGRATIHGRVSSLLEVGTGFHPEMTGRENVYMNGTILGMTKREIDRKFDEIVDFSGVEKFLDTPTKRYSSGMTVRLAFAVAAHLEPEILIIDEVLAVGDAEFQKKCLGKMQDVAHRGRTVLFVSHNMAAVSNLCSRGILLQAGQLDIDDTADAAIEGYSKRLFRPPGRSGLSDAQRTGTGDALIVDATLLSLSGDPICSIPMGNGFCLRLRVEGRCAVPAVAVAVGLYDHRATQLCTFNSTIHGDTVIDVSPERPTTIDCVVRNTNLMPGHYSLNLALHGYGSSHAVLDYITGALQFEVLAADVFATGRTPRGGMIFFPATWDYRSSPPAPASN